MRISNYLFHTLKETPAEAEVPSHRLMLRSGMINQVAAGIYNYLPLGLRSIRKVENIVREEMDRAGAIEILMPAIQPAELWQESGRWEKYGKELLRFQDRKERDFIYGPTHEEVVTDVARRLIKSYRHLPVNLYQIQTKFRDEFRPRFGIMRGREFIMKDAYSFDTGESGAEESYRKMEAAYHRIFTRCGLKFRAVEADTGSIGGSYSHEFMVLADTGEDEIAACDTCEYAANTEKATSREEPLRDKPELLTMEKVHTPGAKTIKDLAEFLGVTEAETGKSLIYNTDQGLLVVLLRGDLTGNDIKIANQLGLEWAIPATEEEIKGKINTAAGFCGPIGLDVRVVADRSVKNMANFAIGANEVDYHYKNVNIPRDLDFEEYYDFTTVSAGDGCPRCDNGTLQIMRGIEVGHIFKLGTKYSEMLKAEFLEESGKQRAMVMGCYGIGISRTVAASIEQSHDDKGIIWPMALAPYEVYLLVIKPSDDQMSEVGDAIYNGLKERGIEVLYDDRPDRAGVKFNDADLLGLPLRITVGKKAYTEGVIEVKWRTESDLSLLEVEGAIEKIAAMIEDKRQGDESK
jgi:prolyl-tRNA synthetase